MLKKETQQESYEEFSRYCEEDIKFDWTDILALTIAAFQVLLPYVLILGASVFVIMILFQFLAN